MYFTMYSLQKTLIRDLKYVLRVLIMYIPLPLFWALFDQQGSRWTLMCQQMNGYIVSTIIIQSLLQLLLLLCSNNNTEDNWQETLQQGPLYADHEGVHNIRKHSALLYDRHQTNFLITSSFMVYYTHCRAIENIF